MSRPERIAPPDVFYDEKEAGKYTHNSRMIRVQTEMAERCIELLKLPEGESKFILDIGCGSGLSGDVLTEAGHSWVGIDISPSMLDQAVDRDVEGDVLLGDMGQGFGFRAGVFDGVISVSALQWLCYSDKKDHRAAKRLKSFFACLYRALRRGGRAALQFYPETPEQMELVAAAAKLGGFTGGIVVDNPHSTKAKKIYLCITAGQPGSATADSALTGGARASGSGASVAGAGARSELIVAGSRAASRAAAASAVADDDDEEEDDDEGMGGGGGGDDDDEEGDRATVRTSKTGRTARSGGAAGGDGTGIATQAYYESRRVRTKKGSKVTRVDVKSREWILRKKESQRRRGAETRPDSKYTGRKRKGHGF